MARFSVDSDFSLAGLSIHQPPFCQANINLQEICPTQTLVYVKIFTN